MTTATRTRPAQPAVQETTEQKLARLKTLREQSGKLAYERVRLCCEVYDDKEWVASTFETPELAEAHLETEYLADLCGAVSFAEVYRIYGAVPAEDDWRQCKYNLKRLYALMLERQPEPDRPQTERRRATIQQVESLEKDKRDLEYMVKRQEERQLTLLQENEQLRAKVARLEGQVEELRAMLAFRKTG